MSIYLVRLSEWFPPDDEQFDICYSLIKSMRCHSCGGKVRYKAAWGHHSLPWGYGDLFCGQKCARSGKVAKTDKRRERRFCRKFIKFELLLTKE